MKIGFIGNGKSTHRYHLPFIHVCGLFEVIGYFSRGQTHFSMPYEHYANTMQAFASIEELCNAVDLVIITTPTQWHYEFAYQCLSLGKHVVIEKPFCATLEQAKALFTLAKANKCILMPYQNRRFDSDFLAFKNIIQEPLLGDIMEIESNHTHYRTDGADHSGSKYEGSIYNHAVHFIDQIISIYGEPDQISYDLCNQKNYYIGSGLSMNNNIPEDYYDLKFIYHNMRVRIRFSQLIVKDPPRWIVHTPLASAEKYNIDQQERDLKLGLYPINNPNFGHDTNFPAYIYFKDGKTKIIPPDYRGYQCFYHQLYLSITEGKPALISEQECLTVINILETIVNNKPYQALFK